MIFFWNAVEGGGGRREIAILNRFPCHCFSGRDVGCESTFLQAVKHLACCSAPAEGVSVWEVGFFQARMLTHRFLPAPLWGGPISCPRDLGKCSSQWTWLQVACMAKVTPLQRFSNGGSWRSPMRWCTSFQEGVKKFLPPPPVVLEEFEGYTYHRCYERW